MMSSLDEAWAKRNWLRYCLLAIYYVFFTVIHGLNSILPTANDLKNLFEMVLVSSNSSVILVLYIAYFYGIFTIGTRLFTNNLSIDLTKNVINCWVLWLTTASPFIQIITQSRNPLTYSKKISKDVSLAFEDGILPKLLVYLRFIKRIMLALVIQRRKKTWISSAIYIKLVFFQIVFFGNERAACRHFHKY